MNIENRIAAIVTLLVAAFALGCGPVKHQNLPLDNERPPSAAVAPCDLSPVDGDGSGAGRLDDPTDGAFTRAFCGVEGVEQVK